jgi:hypothetical protein
LKIGFEDYCSTPRLAGLECAGVDHAIYRPSPNACPDSGGIDRERQRGGRVVLFFLVAERCRMHGLGILFGIPHSCAARKSFGEQLKMARRLFLTLAYALLNYSSTANYC